MIMQNSHERLGRFTIVLAGLLAVAIVMFGCGVAAAEQTVVASSTVESVVVPSPEPTATETPNLQRVTVKYDYTPAKSIAEMFEASSVVVFGRVTGMVDQIDMATWAGSSSGNYELGRVYEIEVVEYLRGDGPEAITFVQAEAHYRYGELTDDAIAEIRASTPDYENGVPKFDEDYVFFLRKWHVDWRHFIAARWPDRVWFQAGKGIVEGNLSDSASRFTPFDSDELWVSLRELQDRFTPEPTEPILPGSGNDGR